jgi:hypothetical protein
LAAASDLLDMASSVVNERIPFNRRNLHPPGKGFLP